MMLRDQLAAALKDAMKSKNAERLSTVRLIQAAIKDRDIANRGAGKEEAPRSRLVIIAQGLTRDAVAASYRRLCRHLQTAEALID